MAHVLILNLHQKYEGFANGGLNAAIAAAAAAYFRANGDDVETTVIQEGYDVAEELEKFRRADLFFVQTPVYWMGLPWLGKKYVDEIFSGGSGGLMKGKRYMLSFTYNCPAGEFDNPDGFFEGLSVDGANVALHKTFQFCGAVPVESFSVHNVYGDFDLDAALKRLQTLLGRTFG